MTARQQWLIGTAGDVVVAAVSAAVLHGRPTLVVAVAGVFNMTAVDKLTNGHAWLARLAVRLRCHTPRG